MPGPIGAFENLDDVEWVCPCGARLVTNGCDNARWFAWLRTHRPHCDGTYRMTCTDDGARAVVKYEPVVLPLSQLIGPDADPTTGPA